MKLGQRAFSIVELLVVIAVIGVIATLIIVSFSSIVSRARDAGLKSDLSTNSVKLKAYHSQYGSYPTSFDSNNCPTAPVATTDPNYCLKLTNSNNLSSYEGTSLAFNLQITNSGTTFQITNLTSPVLVTTPGAPVITTITPGSGQLSVNFTAGSDGGTTITNYQYSTNGGSTWTARSPVSTSSPIVITGLTNGTSYNVRIRPINSVGIGEQSNQVTATVANTPAAPTISSITAGSGQASVNFTAGSDGGSAITNYEYSTNGGTNWTARSPASTSSPIVITGLTDGTAYNVRIRAVNIVGAGTQSNQVSTTPGSPAAPIMGYVSTGVFEVTNTIASEVTYSTTLISGSGTATQSTVGGKIRYTLSSTTARFSVTASWSSGGTASAADYMERKPYTYTAYPIYGTCCNPTYGCWKSCGCECGGGGCGCYGNSGQSWGQCGCPGTMCWYNWGTCGGECYSCQTGTGYNLNNEPGYINSGSEWYKVS